MENSLIDHVFNKNKIRTVIIDDNHEQPLFVAIDVAKALGYKRPNDAVNQFCDDAAIHRPIIDALGRAQETRVIPEPDVYRLIFNSKLKSAREFQNWVFTDVLPKIRKTGAYVYEKKIDELSQRLRDVGVRDAVLLAAKNAIFMHLSGTNKIHGVATKELTKIVRAKTGATDHEFITALSISYNRNIIRNGRDGWVLAK